MLAHVGGLLFRKKDTPKICPIRRRSEPYLEVLARSGIAKYAREAKAPPCAMVRTMNNSFLRSIMPKPEDIVFTETDANWVHHPYEDALVITTKIANSLIH